ncbi:MAG TPA: efflux RND transporter periplasmic adaptor subunit, partial [Nitrospirota bacterium]|nr:efflux RND transporter periplasmic adaptor subunit [Nitrospirota bacterium]
NEHYARGTTMRIRLIIAGIVITAGVIVALFLRYGNTRDQEGLVLSGNVEVTEVDVGFKIPGRVQSLYTDEGKKVVRGDRIAALDSDELESVVTQNRASVQNAEAQYEKTRKDLERYTVLYRDGVVSTQQMDSAKAAYDVAVSQLRLSRASLKTAEVRFKDAVIYAPLNGVVIRKNIEEGETVGAGTAVFTIGDLENPWIKVYVKEDKLGFVKLGQKAEIRVDTYPMKSYEGTVTYISSEAEFTPKNVQTQEERVKLVFGVKVSVKNQNDELKPGMPADVRILPKGRNKGQGAKGKDPAYHS